MRLHPSLSTSTTKKKEGADTTLWLKVAFFQKVRFVFKVFKSAKKNIPDHYPELEIEKVVSCYGREFHVHDSDFEIFWGGFVDLKNQSHFLKKDTFSNTTIKGLFTIL